MAFRGRSVQPSQPGPTTSSLTATAIALHSDRSPRPIILVSCNSFFVSVSKAASGKPLTVTANVLTGGVEYRRCIQRSTHTIFVDWIQINHLCRTVAEETQATSLAYCDSVIIITRGAKTSFESDYVSRSNVKVVDFVHLGCFFDSYKHLPETCRTRLLRHEYTGSSAEDQCRTTSQHAWATCGWSRSGCTCVFMLSGSTRACHARLQRYMDRQSRCFRALPAVVSFNDVYPAGGCGTPPFPVDTQL